MIGRTHNRPQPAASFSGSRVAANKDNGAIVVEVQYYLLRCAADFEDDGIGCTLAATSPGAKAAIGVLTTTLLLFPRGTVEMRQLLYSQTQKQ